MKAIFTAPKRCAWLFIACCACFAAWLNPAMAEVTQADRDYVLSLLKEKNYQALDAHLTAFQEDYRQGQRDEEDLYKIYQGFNERASELEPYFSQWIKQYPDSYPAYLARGSYYQELGWEARGGAYINKTSRKQIAGMESYFTKAMQDLQTSVNLDNKPILSFEQMMNIAMAQGQDELKERWLEEAIKIDPKSYVVRRAYIKGLRPRWGGSIRQMEEFVAQTKNSPLSETHLRRLEGQIFVEKGYQLQVAGDDVGALRLYTQASAVLVDPVELLESKSRLHIKLGEYQQALPDLNKLITLNPDSVYAVSNRGFCYWQLGKNQEAFRDMSHAAKLQDGWAQSQLGVMYYFGVGTAVDKQEAMKWFRAAAVPRVPEAQHNLNEALGIKDEPKSLWERFCEVAGCG